MKRIRLTKNRVVFILIIILVILPNFAPNNYTIYIADRGLANSIAVLGLVVLYGMTGQITQATMSFFALGAYTAAVAQMSFNVDSVLAMFLGILMATLWGIIISIPSFKLTGPFLTISTVAFGEIVRIAFINMVSLTNGPTGLNKIPKVVVFSHTIATDTEWYYILLAVVILTGIVVLRLRDSHYGRAFYAVKDDELAASLMGVNVRFTKTIAFTFASMVAGISGSMYAHLSGFLTPNDFAQQYSNNVLSMVVLGGGDLVIGGIVAAISVTSLP
jgi:branched-chain amino acid transport system permease protein